jgi:hypothetical protein
MKRFLLFALAVSCWAQVTRTSSTVVTATAGPVLCVFTAQTPTAPTGVHAVCSTSGVIQLTMDTVIPVGSTNGIAGTYAPTGGTISWIFTQATITAPITYQVAATPAGGTQSQGSGNF